MGAGISGIGAGISLLRQGWTSVVILESGAELGGTWRDNTYPGVAVDIPSSSYCFSFETDYPWSRAFAPGDEILAYIQHCARKYKVLDHIRFNASVRHARFEPAADRWTVHLKNGETISARFLIAATGLFGRPKLPDIDGLGSFSGQTMHSSQWDHSLELSQRRVAIIGTGASAVQIIPELAARVGHLTVFQRTPIWVGTRLDYALPALGWLAPRSYGLIRTMLRLVSELSLEVLTFAIVNYRRLPVLVRLVQRLVRHRMRQQLHRPELAAQLLPDYGLGCKRPASSNSYLTTFNLSNVELVSCGIDRIDPAGVVDQDGRQHPADILVLATGFQTTEKGNGPTFTVVGKSGVELSDFWDEHRLQAYAGVSVPDYPNFFLIGGPYSGGFNWFTMLEAHLTHIMRCLKTARQRGVTRVEVRKEAHDRYMKHMWERSEGTIFKDASCRTANSYYLDRHGDAALPIPRTPWWRVLWSAVNRTRDYAFGSDGDQHA